MKAIFFEIFQQDKKSADLSVPGFQGYPSKTPWLLGAWKNRRQLKIIAAKMIPTNLGIGTYLATRIIRLRRSCTLSVNVHISIFLYIYIQTISGWIW
jgi:hypothetical protein